MKRFWHTCLAMIALATMTAGVANAQNDWNVPSEIGSYQSILSRAGYGNGMPATSGGAVGGSGTANMSGLLNGGPVGGSGSVNGSASVNGGGVLNDGGVLNNGMVTGEVVNGGAIPYNGSASSVMGQPIGTAQPLLTHCLLYTSPSPRDKRQTRMPSSA